MNVYLSRFTSNKILMKMLMKYMIFFQEGSILSYILLFIKYIPLLIVTHEWKTQKNLGLNALFGKLSITNYLTKETDIVFSNLFAYFFIMINFALILIFGFSYSKLTSFDVKLKKYKVLLLKSLYILCFLNFFCPQYFYELCTLIIAKSWYNSSTDPSQSGAAFAFKIINIPIVLVSFVTIIVQNYVFTLMNFRPYYIKKTYYANRINSLGYKNILYPALMTIVAIEPYVGLFTIVYFKIIFRVFYIYHFIMIVLSSHLKQYYLELFISAFCFISVLIEFLFIKQFFDVKDEADFSLNPKNYSTLYNNNFLFSKLGLQILIAGIICMMGKIYERNFITYFFENIKGKFTYCFYNKNFEFLARLKNGEIREDIISSISKNINIHISKCNNTDCLCAKYKTNLGKEDHFDSKIFVKNLINMLEINLKENLKRYKHSNSETYSKYLMVDTIYSLYFKKHYAKCFFNIEKIQRQSFYKKNFNLQIQVFWLKYEVIVDFIKLNKTSSLVTFRRMRENYEKYNTYKDLETGFIKILNQYKNLITLFYTKQINFSDFYEFLELFYKSISEGDKLIKFIMANHDQHNSLHIRKIDYISKFLKGENTFIPSHKMDQYLTLTDDDKSEKLIVKHTTKKEFLIDYISPKLAEQLSLKTSDIIGNDIHKFMSPQFIEFHYSHIVGHIKNNMLLIKNKEIYFVDKHGYCVNYFVDGSVLITLSGEILVFCEVKSVCLEYNKRNVSFMSCDEEGEIIAISKKFADNFYIDVNVKNVVQPNVFKNILNLNKNKLNFVNNQLNLKFPYNKFIKNIRAIDYSKLWDFNNINYFKYLENLNKDKYPNLDKVDLHFQVSRRNLQEKFFFYDFKINIYFDEDINPMKYIVTTNGAKITPTKNGIDLATVTGNFTETNIDIVNKNTSSRIRNDLNKIKSFSIFIRRWGKNVLNNQNPKQDNQKYLKEKLEKIDLAKIQNLKYSNNFIRMIIFILLILGIFLFLGDFTAKVFYQVEIFAKMRLKIFKLKQKNYYIINSIYSINSVTGQLQPAILNLKNLNYSTNIDNSILYHLNSLKTRRDNYQIDFHNLHNYYLNLDEFLMDKIASIFNTQIEYKILGNDWSILKENSTYFDIIEYDYRGVSKILSDYAVTLKDNSNEIIDFERNNKLINKFLLYDPNSYDFYYQLMDRNNLALNPSTNKKEFPPTLRDKNIFYFLENSLKVFKAMYDNMEVNFGEVFVSLVTQYKTKLVLIFIIICLLLILFFIYEGISFYFNYNKVFEKYFILYDILKKYMDELYIKTELLEELFFDFTDSNRNKYLKLACDKSFMMKKLNKCDTLKESYADVKNKIAALGESKSSIRKSFLSKNIKTNRLLDYYEDNIKRKVKLPNLLQGNPQNNLANVLNPDTTLGKAIKTTSTEKFKESKLSVDYFNYSDLNNIKNLTQNENANKVENLNSNLDVDLQNNQEENKLGFGRSNLIKEENENDFDEEAVEGNVQNHKNSNLVKFKSTAINEKFSSDNNLIKNDTFKLVYGNNQNKKNLSVKKTTDRKHSKNNNKSIKDINQGSTLSTFNKTDSNFLPNINTNTNLNKENQSINEKNEENEIEETVRKSKKFYLVYSLFWIQLVFIFSLIILNIDNTGKRFEKIKTFNEYSEIFYKRIILSSEILMIYQMSLFSKKSDYLIEKSYEFLDKVYSEFIENEKHFLILNNNYNEILTNLKDLEAQINLKDNFCKFLSENMIKNESASDKTQLYNDLFINCQQVSQNFFSVGFAKAIQNLYNYMTILNKDFSNFYKDLKNGNSKFNDERIKKFLNDFYYVFSSVNQDRIIYFLYEILDKEIISYEISLKSQLENMNNFSFYSLYVLIILLGLFSICKTKTLIHNSDKLINYTTDVVENGIKFTNVK